MNVSIITPTHNPKYLDLLWDSIKDQPFNEWLIVINGGAQARKYDDRVRVVKSPIDIPFVGALKRFGFMEATGDILVEVDHDDILMPGAIEKIKLAFVDKEVGFVYSDCANFKDDFLPVDKFGADYGWKYYKTSFAGNILPTPHSFEPTPASISRIWFAPNHVRAWRRDAYLMVDGHDPTMRVLDDQDLIARTFQVTKFKHINQCLYLYRIDGNNTWIKNNDYIQQNTMLLYHRDIEKLALRWAQIKKLKAIDLGGGINPAQGYEVADISTGVDLNEKWPWPDNSVGVLRSFDCFEHLNDPLHVMSESYRVLVPGGYMFVQVPSTDGRGAFQDPTHKSFWNENSFLYYTHARWARYINTPVRFQAMHLETTSNDNLGVCWVNAHLVSLKEGYRPPGLVKI